MPALRELQQQMIAALLEDRQAAALALLQGAPVQSEAGLAIYRNNATAGFAKALAMQFPVIQKLVGEDYFGQLAHSYQQLYPSTSGDLQNVGAAFPAFLRQQFNNSDYAYLPDVAELEWHREMLSVAAPEPALQAQALASVAPEDYERLRLQLQPASRLHASRYPVLQIWQSNQDDSNCDTQIDLNAVAEHMLSLQTDHGVQLLELSGGQFALLRSLANFDTLGVALEKALAADAQFNLGSALALCFSQGCFVRFDLSPLPESLSWHG